MRSHIGKSAAYEATRNSRASKAYGGTKCRHSRAAIGTYGANTPAYQAAYSAQAQNTAAFFFGAVPLVSSALTD